MAASGDGASLVRHGLLSERGFMNFGWTGGVLLFVALSGCLVAILPFGPLSQVAVVAHTLVGVLAIFIFAVWQLNHWLQARALPPTRRQRLAYLAFWLLVASVVTGMVVACQALFGRYVSVVWDWLHLCSSLILLPLLAYHLWPARAAASAAGSQPFDDAPARRRMWFRASCVLVLLVTACGALSVYFSRRQHLQVLAYDIADSNFQPSMVDTVTGRPIPVELLAGSDSCGTADCHASIYQEWRASAHRWSAEDEFFQEVRAVTTRVKGLRETEKCGACHDPVSMLSGHKDPLLGRDAPGMKEGDSCIVCHAVRRIDERGIGSYVLGAPRAYLFDLQAGRFARFFNHFLIRAYPDQHNRDYDLALLRKPESCAPCHKEFDVLDEKEGPVQVETQFDDWKHGKWNTDPDPSKRLYCQQCHMYLVTTQRAIADPYDLKTELGRRHRNHAFAAANQYMPHAVTAHDWEGHTRRVEEWLRGEREVPEIGTSWPRGPIVQLQLNAPQNASPRQDLALTIKLINRKAGHGFPTGPLNIARAWIEVVVQDASGDTVFHSGLLDERNRIEDGTYVLKPLAINTAGKMVMKPDLWHPVGPQFRPAIPAGDSATFDYRFRLPANAVGPLTVKARLRYAKANQFFMDAVYPAERRRAPVTDLSSAQAMIAIIP